MLGRESNEAIIEEFWREKLKGISLPIILGKTIPTVAQEKLDRAETNSTSTSDEPAIETESEQKEETYGHASIIFDNDFLADIQRHAPTPVEHLLFGCLLVLMYRYTGETDFTLGFSRDNSDPLPVRVILDKSKLEFQHLTEAAFNSIRESDKHPLSSQKIRSILPDYIQSALFAPEDAYDISLHISSESPNHRKNLKPGLFAFDVSLTTSEARCTLHYACSKYDAEFINNMLQQFRVIVSTALKNHTYLPTDFPIASSQEITDAEAYNDTDAEPVFKNMSVTDVLHSVAQQFPDQDAIIFQSENRELSDPIRMTYRQLDERVTALAYYLRHVAKLQHRERIGVSLQRSTDLFVAILAIIRAGLVLVTLGSNKDLKVRNIYQYKADHSNIALFLTDDETKELLAYKDNNVLLNISTREFQSQLSDIQRRLSTENADEKITFVPPVFDPAKTVYIMYSSGSSTGIPSGIKISHEGLMNLLNHHANKTTPKHKAEISIARDDADALFYQIAKWLALQLMIVTTTNSGCMDVAFVASLMKQHEVYYADLLANFLRKLLEYDLRSLGVVITMGESSEANTFTHVNRNYPHTQIIEGYGPTECTICATDDSVGNFGMPGILGKPVANTKMYVLTGNGERFAISPHYVPGEIVIFGRAVGKGYLDKSQDEGKFIYLKRTSAQTFELCEAHEHGAERCYLTGDYGRFVRTPDGKSGIQFLWRKDEVIKINGVTVNPVGIRFMLLNHTEIQKLVKELVIVPVRDKHNNNLITSLLGLTLMHEDYNSAISDEDLNLALREYMADMPLQPIAIPRFTRVASIPLTPTGKINSKELEVYAAELIEEEERAILHPDGAQDPNIRLFLIKLCAGIIGVKEDSISTEESFANLGIASKTITSIIATINRVFQLSKYPKYELRYGSGPENIKEENINDLQCAAVTIEQLTALLTRRLATIKQQTGLTGTLNLGLRDSQLRMLTFGNNLPLLTAPSAQSSDEKSSQLAKKK